MTGSTWPRCPRGLKKLLLHPLTDRGLEQFLADWNKVAAPRGVGLTYSHPASATRPRRCRPCGSGGGSGSAPLWLALMRRAKSWG